MGQRHILHCDCNCFYASVEMQEHPELRGKSIAVCGDPEARHGIVLTASYPAKRMGVKTGMPIWEAKQHCRDLIVVPASYGKYQKYSSYVREIFRDYTDQMESFGLDEAWLDITGSLGLFGDPVKIAKEISARIKRELGITVSIGVSFNKITAKLGSDYKKSDAITVIEPDTYKQIVYPLPVGDLLYVGNATQRKLGSYGIRTIGQLALCGGIAAADGALCWPLPGHTYISCHFGEVDAFGNAGHRGTDIPAPEGTPILAAHSGTVLISGWNDSYGNQVLLDNGAGLSTRYAHMTQTAVTAGEAVTAGQVIGYVGSTGDSTGNHLHFEVMQGGVRMNPLELVFGQ